MKVLLLRSAGMINALLDHCDNVTEKYEGATACMVESPMQDHPDNMPVINTCIGIKNYLVNEKLRDAVLNEMIGVSKNQTVSELFGLFNGDTFSDIIETSYSTRFMTYNIGPRIGFVCGVGVKVTTPLDEAIPNFKSLVNFLKEIKYRGEVSIGVDDTYCITGFSCGHHYGHFAIYSEMSACNTSELLGYILRANDNCSIHDTCCVANLVSKQPFPCSIPGNGSSRIAAPKSAEKHLWRLNNGTVEPVLITTHGSYLKEAQKRLQRTIDNMITFDPDIQYRTDYGMRGNFVLSKDKYEVFKVNPYYSSRSSQAPSSLSQ